MAATKKKAAPKKAATKKASSAKAAKATEKAPELLHPHLHGAPLSTDPDLYIPSGIYAIDGMFIGSGLPRDIHIEISADSGMGKSTLVMTIFRMVAARLGKRCVFFDAENGVNAQFLTSMMVAPLIYDKEKNPKGLIHIERPNSLEAVDRLLTKYTRDYDDIAMICVDSISSLYPEEMMQGEIGSVRSGKKQDLEGQLYVKWKNRYVGSRPVWFWIAHQKNKFGASSFNGFQPRVSSLAEKCGYMGDVRWVMRNHETLKRTVTTPHMNEEEIKIGRWVKLACTKSRWNAQVSVLLPLFFGKGVSNVQSVLDVLHKAGYIVQGGSWFSVMIPGLERGDAHPKFNGWEALSRSMKEDKDLYAKMLQFALDQKLFAIDVDYGTAMANVDGNEKD